MFLKTYRLAFAVSAISLVTVGGASATLVNAEYTGTLRDGYDGAGIFGAVGSDLTGLNFVADFLYNTALGTYLYSSPTVVWLEGGPGTSSGGISPFLSASVTVNGVTNSIIPDSVGQAIASNGQNGLANQVYHNAATIGGDDISVSFYNSSSISGDIPATIDVPLIFMIGAEDTGVGSASFAGPTGSTNLYFSPVALTYTLPTMSAVPEASTWTMMLIGFSGLCYAAASRRPRKAASLEST